MSPGRTTEHRKRAATGLKSRSLKVTMASVRPLMAVSRTISSFVSGSIGRVRIISSTLFPTKVSSSSTADTSSLLASQAARCSGRVRADSYSSIRGTDKTIRIGEPAPPRALGAMRQHCYGRPPPVHPRPRHMPSCINRILPAILRCQADMRKTPNHGHCDGNWTVVR